MERIETQELLNQRKLIIARKYLAEIIKMWIFFALIMAMLGNIPFTIFFLIMELLFGCTCTTNEDKYRKELEELKEKYEKNR